MTILLFLAHRFLNDTSFLYQLAFAGTSGVIASAIVTFFADRANANNRKYLKFVYLRGLHILVEGIVSQNEYIYANGWDKFFEKNKYNIERWLEVVDRKRQTIRQGGLKRRFFSGACNIPPAVF